MAALMRRLQQRAVLARPAARGRLRDRRLALQRAEPRLLRGRGAGRRRRRPGPPRHDDAGDRLADRRRPQGDGRSRVRSAHHRRGARRLGLRPGLRQGRARRRRRAAEAGSAADVGRGDALSGGRGGPGGAQSWLDFVRRDIVALWPQNLRRYVGRIKPSEYPPELARLPPGRHGLPREFVAHNQRERLIAGLAEAIAENGYAGTTIAHITRHAAVSRRTFYEHFASKDECFVAAYDTVMEELRERVAAAFEERGRLAARGQGRDRRDARASSPPSPTSPASAWSRRWSPARSWSSATTRDPELRPLLPERPRGPLAGGPRPPLADHRGGPGRRHGLADLPPHHRRQDRRAGGRSCPTWSSSR